MHHLRYNIAGALGAIVFVAVGFAALREADELRDSWLFSLTLGLLMLAVLLAVRRTGDRRAFWIGFALFGWGYLSLSLIPSIEPRLIATEALAHLYRTNLLGVRPYGVRATLALDRMREHNLSSDDILKATQPSRMVSPEQLGQATGRASRVDGSVLTWESDGRYNDPNSYENIIVLANRDGEVVRIKDVATVEVVPPFSDRRVMAGTAEDFIRVGHSLFALLAAWLGGVLSRRLGSVSESPGVLMEGE